MVGQGTEKNVNADSNKSDSPIMKPGRILGRVFDADSGEALMGVTVVIEESKTETKTDLEGRYRLTSVKPGNYSLLFFKESYERVRVKVDEVESGRTKLVDLPLNPDYSDLETLDAFEITSEELGGTDIQLLALRQESMVVMDAMGSFDMSRLGAGNVADALTKMVGTSLQDGKYVVVRGLADRYSNATFNGVPIPSSDVYRNTPQLDLFPSIAVDSIKIMKTMSPELGPAFAGGSVDVSTKAYPEEFKLSVTVGTKYSELVHGEDKILNYDGFKNDFWGFGTKEREIPENFANMAQAEIEKLFITGISPEKAAEINKFNQSIDPEFMPKYEDPGFDQSIGIEYGDFFEWQGMPIGIMASFDFEHSFYSRPYYVEQQILNYYKGFHFLDRNSYKMTSGGESSEIAGFFQFVALPNDENELGFITLYSHTGDKRSTYARNLYPGLSGEDIEWGSGDPVDVERYELSWNERDMIIPQFYGKHSPEFLDEGSIEWRYATTTVSMDDPLRKSFQRAWNENGDYLGLASGEKQIYERKYPPTQTWRSLNDESEYARLDYESQKFENEFFTFSFSLGLSRENMNRTFEENLINYNRIVSNHGPKYFPTDTTFRARGPGYNPTFGTDIHNLFVPDNLGIGDLNVVNNNRKSDRDIFTYLPTTPPIDYKGNSETRAYYLGMLFEFSDNYRISTGVRQETMNISVNPVDDPGLPPMQTRNDANINIRDFYPSLTFSKDWENGMKFSSSLSSTTARPNFRELAFIATEDRVKGTIFKGNPQLKPSDITNYDIRVDWNLSDSEIISASLFYKEIDRPIQQAKGNDKLQIPVPNGDPLNYAPSETTFINSKSALVYGLELEGKIAFERINEILTGFKLGGNLVWSDSELTLDPGETGIWGEVGGFTWNDLRGSERLTRKLEGQSEWIYNVDFSYTNEDWGTVATLVYSFYDERLRAVSYLTYDDVWEDEYDSLDVILSQKFGKHKEWNLKFAAKNLTTPDRIERIYQTDVISSIYETGKYYSISLSKDF